MNRVHVVDAARKYLGAKWRHQARDANALDCAGLVVRVARDLGLTAVSSNDYPEHPDGARLLAECQKHMRPIPKRDFDIGDVLVMRFSAAPQHFGIVADYFAGGFSLIHAYRGADMVVEHRLDDIWRRRIVAAYQLPGIE